MASWATSWACCRWIATVWACAASAMDWASARAVSAAWAAASCWACARAACRCRTPATTEVAEASWSTWVRRSLTTAMPLARSITSWGPLLDRIVSRPLKLPPPCM